jgi:hypothetical protein
MRTRQGSQGFTPPNNMSQPLTGVPPGPPDGGGWDHEASFAKPWIQTPQALRKLSARFFGNPLALNPVTPSPTATRFPARRSLARTFLFSDRSSSTAPSLPPQNRRDSSFTGLFHSVFPRYHRLSSQPGSIGGEREPPLDIECSRPSMSFQFPSPPPLALHRDSQTTMKSVSTEPPRFRPVFSWVQHQSQRQQLHQNQSAMPPADTKTLPSVPPSAWMGEKLLFGCASSSAS